jgi:prefoldin subunit 5
MLKSKREKQEEEGATFDTFFNLSDQVYAQARVNPSGKCSIWLGANVMVEYTYEEAEIMLNANLETAKKKLEEADEDLSYVKDQLTTTEVNMSRTYNYEVQQRRISKQSASINSEDAESAGGKKKGNVEARVTLGGKTITI